MSHLVGILRFAWPYLRRYWFRLTIAVLAGLAFAASNASFLFVVKIAIARVLPPDQQADLAAATLVTTTAPTSGWLAHAQTSSLAAADHWLPLRGRALDWKQIAGGLIFFSIFAVLRSACSYLSAYCMTWVSAHFITDLRADLLKKLYSLSLDFYQRSTVGDLTNRLVADTQALYSSVSTVFADLIKEPATILAIIIASLWIDWHLTLFALLILPLCIVPAIILGNKVRRAVRSSVNAAVAQSNLMIESLSGIRVVKAYHLEKENTARFSQQSENIVHHSIKQAQAEGLINPTIEIVSSTAFGLLILYVVWGNVSLPNMFSVLMGVIFFFAPIRRLTRVHFVLQSGSISAVRMEAIMNEQPSVRDSAQPRSLTSFQQEIHLDHVSFAYGSNPVLQGINLKIPKGTALGIAGESGSGKSTLVNLLLRFYDPASGAIRLDGLDLREVAAADLRRLIAMVSQEIVIFNGTVAENIGCGKSGASRAEIEEAAIRAHAAHFIQALPQGYDTPVGERGTSLSGGQRQRLAIARAFIRNAPILILDEATASLDSQSESEVQIAIDELAENRTVISIAHRLSTLRRCDQIVVLSQGQVIEKGGFQELLRQSGYFADMAARQGIRV